MPTATETRVELAPNKDKAKGATVALFAASFFASSQSSFSVIGLPHYALEANLTASQLSALLSSFPLATAAASLFSGPVSDLFGRRRLLLAGMVALSVSLVAHPFTNGFAGLFTMRLVTGLACGMLVGLPAMILSDSFALERQRSLIGKSLTGYALGQTLGIPLGVALLDHLGFLGLNAALGALAFAFCFVSANSIPYSVEREPKQDRGHRIRSYLVETGRSLRCSKLRRVALVSFLSFVATSAFYVTIAMHFYGTMELQPAVIAPMYVIAGAIQAFVMNGRIQETNRFRPTTLVSASFILTAIAIAAFGFAADSAWSAFAVYGLFAGTVALRIPSIQHLINHLGPTRQKGLRMSISQVCSQLGKALGASATVALIGNFHLTTYLLIIAALLVPCSIVYASLSPSPHPRSPEDGVP